MFYYIGINSWNLLESFVSESISPFSFYQVRGYGNNLSRYIAVSYTHLTLPTNSLV